MKHTVESLHSNVYYLLVGPMLYGGWQDTLTDLATAAVYDASRVAGERLDELLSTPDSDHPVHVLVKLHSDQVAYLLGTYSQRLVLHAMDAAHLARSAMERPDQLLAACVSRVLAWLDETRPLNPADHPDLSSLVPDPVPDQAVSRPDGKEGV